MPGPDRSSFPAPRDGTLPRSKRHRAKRTKVAGLPLRAQAKRAAKTSQAGSSNRRLFIEVADTSLEILPPTMRAPIAAHAPVAAPTVALLPEVSIAESVAPAVEAAAEGQDQECPTGSEPLAAAAPVAAMPEVDGWAGAPIEAPSSEAQEIEPAAIVVEPASAQAAEASEAGLAIEIQAPEAGSQAPVRRRKRRARPLALAAAFAVGASAAFVWWTLPDMEVLPARLSAVTEATVARIAPAGPFLPIIAVGTLQPSETDTLPPLLATAAHGTDDLIAAAVLPPTAGERVIARTATRADLVAPTPGRKPAVKPSQQAAATVSRPASSAEGRRDGSRGPILDFFSRMLAD